MRVTALIVDAGSIPVYFEIGEKAAHLRELGMSDRTIAGTLGVSDKTVAKSLRHGPTRRSPTRADRAPDDGCRWDSKPTD